MSDEPRSPEPDESSTNEETSAPVPNPDSAKESSFEAPHPGSKRMPRWETGELVDAPRFTAKNWFALLGPGLVMGGAAIGGGGPTDG